MACSWSNLQQYAAKMKFCVVTADDAATFYDGEFKFGDGGLLCVYPVKVEEPNVYLSPAFWRQVSEVRSEESTVLSKA
jgi:hypothetical protein